MPYDAQRAFQICPIILTGGIAESIPGGMLPMFSLFGIDPSQIAGPNADLTGVLPVYNPGLTPTLDNSFAAFNVLPGGTLVNQSIGKYPFANQSVAANAVIREPVTLSVIMDAPMRGPNAWKLKQLVMTSLKGALDLHNNVGGLYVIFTPAFLYDNMVMISLTDNSRGNSSLPQNAWRFDFERPLVTMVELQAAFNQFMKKVDMQVSTDTNLSGVQPGSPVGQSPLALFDSTTTPFGGTLTYTGSGVSTTQGLNFPPFTNAASYSSNFIS